MSIFGWWTNRHKHTWGTWYEREAELKTLGGFPRPIMVQCRNCTTCGYMEHTR